MKKAALREARKVIDRATEADDLTKEKARRLLEGYDMHYREGCPYTTVTTEREFALPIINPETGRKSKTFVQGGRYDGIIANGSKRMLLEHKTTSQDLLDLSSPYWRRLAIDSQVSSHLLAHWQCGERLDGSLYDVIRKPTIRPKAIPAGSESKPLGTQWELQNQFSYFGTQVTDDKNVFFSKQETPELYGIRLAIHIRAEPEKYFRRIQVPRLDSEIAEYADELWSIATEIREARRTGNWYRNSSACCQYNTACEYLGVCSGEDDIDSDRWVHRKSNPELDTDDERTLTNSAVKTFQTCRRKYYYRNEKRKEKRDKVHSPALQFGSLIHAALEAWWKHK